MHSVRMEAAAFVRETFARQGRERAGCFRREDRSQRFQRELGRALWFALGIVILWIGAN